MMISQRTQIVDADPLGRQMISTISTLISLKPLSQDKNLSRFYLSRQACIFFSIMGVFVGIYACSSSALAEAEEDINQEVISMATASPRRPIVRLPTYLLMITSIAAWLDISQTSTALMITRSS